jgi:NAD(P)-dependent dehydrogenase (short-subunit alcohol dehydrogenase family)
MKSSGNPNRKNRYEMAPSSKVALVTGANKGIGLEICRQLAEAGIHVLMGARSVERGTAAANELAADGLDVSFVQVDLADAAGIDAAAAKIAPEHGRLDILVNNAGIVDAEDGPPSSASPDAVRRIFETNVLGTLKVTQAMLPSLRAADAARIVNLTSALGSLVVNGDPSSPFYSARLFGYNASKAAVNLLTIQLDAELGSAGSRSTRLAPAT